MSALSNCSTTVWASNATTIVGSPTGIAGFNSTLLNGPLGIAVGTNDSIFVMDYSASYYRMQLFYPGSQSGITIINATGGTGLNQISSFAALNIDVSGNIYILDRLNYCVTKWAPGASTGILVAGGNGQGSSLNQLDSPYDFFVEPNTSYIWIVDYNNCRVVKWMNSSTGVLVAGAGCAYRNLQHISHRAIPLVRRELDKQLTTMILAEALSEVIFVTPTCILNLINYLIGNSSDPFTVALISFFRNLTGIFYYIHFVSPFYIYFCASKRFRQQLIYVLFKVHYNRWRHQRVVDVANIDI
ncbi:unnamed protein product [Adineta steineri]|uniref:NHL repeat protein n=1 Tax=Adineta steineri TaxID=433720 RepID=A0A813XF95_9BILA|nr:unnamed protein product [Adineta steineri]